MTSNNFSDVYVAQPKPLLRGWFHAVGAVGSVVFTIILLLASAHDTPRMISMLIFGLSMIALYTVSAFYHIGNWRPRVHRWLRSLDHSNIFLLIAGTYTPLCFNVLSGGLRTGILFTIWLLTLGGIVIASLPKRMPRWGGTGLYIGMGWVSLLALPDLVNALGWGPVGLLAFGGLLYTVGAIIYAMRRPNPFPRVLGFHEIFHLFVIAGSLVYAAVVTIWILPYPRPY